MAISQRTLPQPVAWATAYIFYFSLIATVLSGYAFYGFIGDAAAYVAYNTYEYSTHPLFPYLAEQDTGHPLIFAWLNGLFWSRFGIQPFIANVSIWLYAAMALVALQYLTQNVVAASLGSKAPRWAGLAAALCLFSTPLFISNTAQYLSALPHLAFSLMMLVAWYRRRPGWLVLWALLLTFTRITGFLSVLGLGLFDLGRELYFHRVRRPRRLLALMLPYVICGFFFTTYLSIKLIALDRPLTTMAQNELFAEKPIFVLHQIRIIMGHSFAQPRYSFSLIIIPIGIALGSWCYRKLGARMALQTDPGASPRNPALYGAFLLVIFMPGLLYAVHELWPQPRWFLTSHALVILAGMHALFFLLPRFPKVVMAALVLWCSLQILRWQPTWVPEIFPNRLRIQRQMAIYPYLTLDFVKQKQLYHRLADWYQERPLASLAFIAAWPTYKVLDCPQSGYIQDSNKVGAIDWLAGDPVRLRNFIHLASAKYDSLYFLFASWDNTQTQKHMVEMLHEYPSFTLESVLKDDARNEIRIYRYETDARMLEHFSDDLAQSNFGARLYRILLDRLIDLSGFEAWEMTMLNATDKPATARETLKALVSSVEFTNKNPSTDLRVTRLFQALHDRLPTAEELIHWTSELDGQSKSINDLIDHLADAPEFEELLSSYFPAGNQ